ncbi:flagellar biogenesis protein [Aurantiacibacter xanthus]|uniref:Flagellar biogenesis protein n=1 Tax=Aurantiacibacter xanthus TaxID=1784712 RepID=A0A3A1P235_9SPHN|nr:flagellar biosynthetic protein FliO [Aurantiacibacter xanthus]RIV81329.1 flagellar biogenesis protein [Aurantiacibacter xanthus]
MGWYLLKLAILLPLIAGMIWGSLKLAKKLQAQVGAGGEGRQRTIKVVETMMLSPGQRLAVIEYNGRDILVASSKAGFTWLAECAAQSRTQAKTKARSEAQFLADLDEDSFPQ